MPRANERWGTARLQAEAARTQARLLEAEAERMGACAVMAARLVATPAHTVPVRLAHGVVQRASSSSSSGSGTGPAPVFTDALRYVSSFMNKVVIRDEHVDEEEVQALWFRGRLAFAANSAAGADALRSAIDRRSILKRLKDKRERVREKLYRARLQNNAQLVSHYEAKLDMVSDALSLFTKGQDIGRVGSIGFDPTAMHTVEKVSVVDMPAVHKYHAEQKLLYHVAEAMIAADPSTLPKVIEIGGKKCACLICAKVLAAFKSAFETAYSNHFLLAARPFPGESQFGAANMDLLDLGGLRNRPGATSEFQDMVDRYQVARAVIKSAHSTSIKN